MPSRKLSGVVAIGVAALLALSGCVGSTNSASSSSNTDSKTITVGFNPGPYEQQFKESVTPILKQQGYTLKTQNFTDGIQVNVALGQGKINANVMQHRVFMESINKQEGLDNVALVQVPGPPMALFAGKLKSLSDVKKGATVSVPNQPSNLYRALKLLQSVGWIKVSDKIDPATASVNDVTENIKGIKLEPLENAQQVRALNDVDFGVIQGNFVVSAGLKLNDALKLENIESRFRVVVAVRKQDQNSKWAQALKQAYQSKTFANYIKSNSVYDGYAIPEFLK